MGRRHRPPQPGRGVVGHLLPLQAAPGRRDPAWAGQGPLAALRGRGHLVTAKEMFYQPGHRLRMLINASQSRSRPSRCPSASSWNTPGAVDRLELPRSRPGAVVRLFAGPVGRRVGGGGAARGEERLSPDRRQAGPAPGEAGLMVGIATASFDSAALALATPVLSLVEGLRTNGGMRPSTVRPERSGAQAQRSRRTQVRICRRADVRFLPPPSRVPQLRRHQRHPPGVLDAPGIELEPVEQ